MIHMVGAVVVVCAEEFCHMSCAEDVLRIIFRGSFVAADADEDSNKIARSTKSWSPAPEVFTS